jgi:prepilin-type N-terminal cleavage/methylation domain-containing protein
VPPRLPVFAKRLRYAPGSRAASRKAQSGFKLLELAVTLTIMSVLASVGMSNWSSLTEKEAVKGHTNALLGAMRFARSEAIKKNAPVVICPRDLAAGGTRCNTASGAGWEAGWLVFTEQSSPPNYVYDSSTDTLLKEEGKLSSSGGITMRNGIIVSDRIVYRSSGILLQGASNIKFLPVSQNETRGSMVCISMQGRARVIGAADSC